MPSLFTRHVIKRGLERGKQELRRIKIRALGCRTVMATSLLRSRGLAVSSTPATVLTTRSDCTDGFKESLDQLDVTLQILPPAADVIVMGDFSTLI